MENRKTPPLGVVSHLGRPLGTQQPQWGHRLGRHPVQSTKEAGLNFILPFIDRISANRSLKEKAVDVPEQSAITKDNISVEIDGVIYMQVSDARAASYGIENYRFAVSQLAQTTLRSEIGKIELDRTFEERETINAQVVDAVDRAAEPWGVKILRYEIKDIVPPDSVKDALESVLTEVSRARLFGFSVQELRIAKLNQIADMEQKNI